MPDRWSQHSKEVMSRFKNPCNIGEIENSDGAGHVGNLVCGDITELHLEIDGGLTRREHLELKHRLSA